MTRFFLARCLGVLLMLWALTFPSQAQTPTPTPTPSGLSGIFNDKGSLGLSSVQSTANAQKTSTPYYKSNGVETRYYEGYFKAAANTSKLALLSDDGTSVWIDGTQVLNRAGQGQGFDEPGATTFYPLSKSFTAGQTYYIKLQYTNTYHIGDADIDGISLWAYDGGGTVIDKFIYLTTSSPNFLVYRQPTTTAPDAPTIEDVTVTGSPSAPSSGGAFADNGDEDYTAGDGDNGPVPDETPIPTETAPPDIIPAADSSVDNPTIQFGVRVSAYDSWRATVQVYSIASATGSLGQPLATLVTTNTQVTWNELFPTTKPASGAYFYNITVEGLLTSTSTVTAERTVGLSGSGTNTQRLNPDLKITNLQWSLIENPPGGSDEQTQLEVTCSLPSGQPQSDTVFLSVVNPHYQLADSVAMQSQGGGVYRGVWTPSIDAVNKMGDYILVAGAQGTKGAALPAKTTPALKIVVGGYAFGFDMLDSARNPIAGNADAKRRPYAGAYSNFKAFVRLQKPGSSTWGWYGASTTSSTVLGRMQWLGGWTPQGFPSTAQKLPTAWKSALGLNVEWRSFVSQVVDQQDHPTQNGKYRWYGFTQPVTKGSGLDYEWQVDLGVSWWGVKIVCNGIPVNKNGRLKYGKWVYQFPTDQVGAKSLFLAGSGQVRTVSTGEGGRKTQVLWSPDPSTGDWDGLIAGRGYVLPPTFATDDPFAPFQSGDAATRAAARAGQGQLHADILGQGESFINAPYSWGGQDYGGRQSTSSNKVSGNVTYSLRDSGKILDPLPSVFDSNQAVNGGATGFGIDCSGFVTEAGRLAGLSGSSFNGYGDGTTVLRTSNLAADVDDEFVRPGDFILITGHVVYVYETPTYELVRGRTRIKQVRTLEAQPNRSGSELGRARFAWRYGSDMRDEAQLCRRWK